MIDLNPCPVCRTSNPVTIGHRRPWRCAGCGGPLPLGEPPAAAESVSETLRKGDDGAAWRQQLRDTLRAREPRA